MNILVTGGHGRMAKKLKSTEDLKFYLPSRAELNLESFDSINNYLENKKIDGLVLNAYHYLPGDVTIDNIKVIENEFSKAAKVNILSTVYLYKKLKDNLKFIILLTTGLDPEFETNYIYYRNSKSNLVDLLERTYHIDKQVKTVFLHPGHMHDDYTYNQSALQLTKFISKIDDLKNLNTYGIFDKDKMQANLLENSRSYETVEIIEL
jgi:hypothetical protein